MLAHMYAIIEVGGRQWRVEPGSRLSVNRLAAAVGAEYAVDRVLLAHDGQQAQLGRPYVKGAKVLCEVLEHPLGPKEISYHFRRRENWRKTVGHRQPLTRLLVKTITCDGARVAEAPAKAAKSAAATAGKRAPAKAAAQKTSVVKPRAKTLSKGATHGA